jgi:hypothetical protein
MPLLAMLVLQDDGLTFNTVIQDIPHDAPAIVVYLMLAIFAALVWLGSRRSVGSTNALDNGPESVDDLDVKTT